jgi:hypothetical protein
MNKYKINNNNNKTNTKHEFNVKYERYKQDISKDRKLRLGKKIFSILIIDKLPNDCMCLFYFQVGWGGVV